MSLENCVLLRQLIEMFLDFQDVCFVVFELKRKITELQTHLAQLEYDIKCSVRVQTCS